MANAVVTNRNRGRCEFYRCPPGLFLQRRRLPPMLLDAKARTCTDCKSQILRIGQRFSNRDYLRDRGG